MSVYAYLSTTVPKIAEKWLSSYFTSNGLLAEMKKAETLQFQGGGSLKIPRVTGEFVGDSIVINETRTGGRFTVKNNFTFGELDWGRFITPLAVLNKDLNRMEGAGQRKLLTKTMLDNGLMFLMTLLLRRMMTGQTLTGHAEAYKQLGTLNGNSSDGSMTGITNGALQFVAPASQTGTYLGMSRVADTTRDVNNFYNQFFDHTGIANDFIDNMVEPVALAESYVEDGSYRPVGVASIGTMTKIARAIRMYGGGAVPFVQATVDEANSGKALTPIAIVNGIKFLKSRHFLDASLGETEGGFILNMSELRMAVNEGENFKFTPFRNYLDITLEDVTGSVCTAEVQFWANSLLSHTAFAKA